jgi:hypothetical protein
MSDRYTKGKRKILKPILNREASNIIYEVDAAAKSARRLPDSMKYYLGRKINGLRVTYDNYETVDREIPEEKLDEMRGEAEKLIALLRAYR